MTGLNIGFIAEFPARREFIPSKSLWKNDKEWKLFKVKHKDV